jgi:hypothetical protein
MVVAVPQDAARCFSAGQFFPFRFVRGSVCKGGVPRVSALGLRSRRACTTSSQPVGCLKKGSSSQRKLLSGKAVGQRGLRWSTARQFLIRTPAIRVTCWAPVQPVNDGANQLPDDCVPHTLQDWRDQGNLNDVPTTEHQPSFQARNQARVRCAALRETDARNGRR